MIAFNKGIFEITKNEFELLKRVVSKDELRLFLNSVYVDIENSCFVATDGKQLVKYDIPDNIMENLTIENSGLYDPIKIGNKYKLIPSDNEGHFPNYTRIISDNLELALTDCIISGKLCEDSKLIFKMFEAVKNPINIDYLMNLKYIDIFDFYINKEKENSAVQMKFKNGLYIVMPMID